MPPSLSDVSPFAAYLYLPRAPGAKAARTLDAGHGIRIDLDERGGLIGLEIAARRRSRSVSSTAYSLSMGVRRSTTKSGRRWRLENNASRFALEG